MTPRWIFEIVACGLINNINSGQPSQLAASSKDPGKENSLFERRDEQASKFNRSLHIGQSLLAKLLIALVMKQFSIKECFLVGH